VTDESPALVDAWVKKHKPEYPIAILKSGKFENAIGVDGFPYGAVIAPDGTQSFGGRVQMMAGPLSEALANAEEGSLFPKSIAKATKLMRENELDKSYGEILKLLAGGKVSEADMPAVEGFKAYLEDQATLALSDAKKFQEDGLLYMATQRLEAFAEAEPPFPATADCLALQTSLEAVPDFKKEVKGGKAYMEAKQEQDAGEYTDAVKGFKTVYKKYDGTRIADRARADAQEIVDQRKTGYKAHCMDCRKARRACEKHYEEVKL
jgi:hypothetical protein